MQSAVACIWLGLHWPLLQGGSSLSYGLFIWACGWTWLRSGKGPCAVGQCQRLLNGHALEYARTEDARVCIAGTVGVYGLDLWGGNVLDLLRILGLAVPGTTGAGPENHRTVQSQ